MFSPLRYLSTTLALFVATLLHAQDAAAPATLPENKADFHVYLLMGQSNMAGRGSLQNSEQTDNPRILSLNAQGKWVIARDPIHAKIGSVSPGVGPGVSFAQAMINATPDSSTVIGLVPCAVGGSPLKRWNKKEEGDLYAQALKQAKAAAKIGTIKGVLWHQGETDSEKQDAANTYETRLSRVIADLRKDLGQPDLPIVVGQLGTFLRVEKQPYAETVRAAIKHISETTSHVGYADSNGLKDKGDKLHFTADAARELGTRYAQAMQKLQK